MLDRMLCLIPPRVLHQNVLKMGTTAQQMKLRSSAQYFYLAVTQAQLRESLQQSGPLCSPLTYITTYGWCYRIWR